MWRKLTEEVRHRPLLLPLTIGLLDMGQRGLDYSTGDDPKTGIYLTRIELGLSLEAWGVLFILAAGTVLAGLVWRQTNITASGSTLACLLYLMLAAGRFDEVWDNGWPPDGWRAAFHYVAVAAIWAYAAYWLALRAAVERDREERRSARHRENAA